MKTAEKTPESVHRPSTLVKTKPATARIEQERTVKISEKTGTPTQKSSQDPNERLLAAAQQLLEITRPAPQIGKARKLLQMALACGADADRIAKLLLIAELIDELEKLKQSVTGNPPIPVERGEYDCTSRCYPIRDGSGKGWLRHGGGTKSVSRSEWYGWCRTSSTEHVATVRKTLCQAE
jgi:hypothetical protein